MTTPIDPPTEALLFRAIVNDEARSSPIWTQDELGDVLAHQLRAPLADDLGRLDPAVDAELRRHTNHSFPLVTFRDLIRHPSPPRSALDALKQFGKAHRLGESPAIGDEIATLLYYSAVLLARVRLGMRISAMNDGQVADGIRWSLSRPWLDGEVRTILQQALAKLESINDDA